MNWLEQLYSKLNISDIIELVPFMDLGQENGHFELVIFFEKHLPRFA